MNNYENPYIRLQTYYSWISRGSYDLDGMSILELHHYTQIPIDTIRQDIAAMLKWQAAIDSKYDGNISFIPENLENRIFLDPENIKDLFKENQSDDDSKLEDKLNCFDPALEEQLLNGGFDHIPIDIENCSLTGCDNFNIALSYDESLALDAIRKDITPDKPSPITKTSFLQIKDSYRTIHDYRELTSRLQIIDEAIKKKKSLSMNYKNSIGEILKITFQPLKISYDESENLYCVLSVSENKIQVYRLDRILDLLFILRNHHLPGNADPPVVPGQNRLYFSQIFLTVCKQKYFFMTFLHILHEHLKENVLFSFPEQLFIFYLRRFQDLCILRQQHRQFIDLLFPLCIFSFFHQHIHGNQLDRIH